MTLPQPLPPGFETLIDKVQLDQSKYYLVIAPDIEIIECIDKDELMFRLRERREEERNAPGSNRVVIVKGQRTHVSKGEFKYVLFPDGDKRPLFVEAADLQPDEDGYLIDLPADSESDTTSLDDDNFPLDSPSDIEDMNYENEDD